MSAFGRTPIGERLAYVKRAAPVWLVFAWPAPVFAVHNSVEFLWCNLICMLTTAGPETTPLKAADNPFYFHNIIHRGFPVILGALGCL
jgi:hypothetical protein